MKNIYVSNLHKKDVDHFTSDTGLYIRRKVDKPFKKLCNIFTGVNIIRRDADKSMTDDEYFESLSVDRIPTESYPLKPGKNNIVVERYPELTPDEPYIFVCNHTCPEDIETILNIIDRNAYLVLGSLDTAQYDPEMYLVWLNGVVPFDILDPEQRKQLMPKMARILKHNSILIFPEGSHNYSPNNLVNPLFDGPINLSLQTGRKIVVCTLIKDFENNVAYVDVSNPLDLDSFGVTRDETITDPTQREKKYVNTLTSCLRDKMATSVYHMLLRHFDTFPRNQYEDVEEHLRQECVEDSFAKMKWRADIFDAEFLVKKTKAEREYEEVIHTLSNLRYNPEILRTTDLNTRQYVLLDLDLQRKNVAEVMRAHWLQTKDEPKKLIKKK